MTNDIFTEWEISGLKTDPKTPALGLDRTGTLLVISHTFREETAISASVRLISERKASRTEAKQYERK